MKSFIFFSALIAVAYGGVLLTGNGVPLDTPEVAHARAAHFAAHAEATARNAGAAVYGAPAIAAAPLAYAAPAYAAAPAVVAAPHIATYAAPESLTYAVPPAFGLPVVDTPEVASAKVYHAAAHHEAKARNLLGYPVAATGYLADTPDVSAAKAAHAASHHDALVRNSPISPIDVYAGPYAGAYAAPYAGAYAAPYAYGHHHLKAHY